MADDEPQEQRRRRRLAMRCAGVAAVLAAAGAIAVGGQVDRTRQARPEQGAKAARPAPDAAALARSQERAQALVSMERLSPAQRAGQVVMSAIPGLTLTGRSARQVEAAHIGGVILFGSNVRSTPQLRRLTRAVHLAGARGSGGSARMLIAVDQEGGDVRRLPASPPFRSARELGRAVSGAATLRAGRATGDALASLGIDLNLAPVADVDSGRARVMSRRSFARDPQRVRTHVVAFIRGLDAAGVAAAVKHYPGFGAAPVNSDDGLARIDRSAARLTSLDLVPFAGAIDVGVDAVMVSHGIYRTIDARRPASVSPAVYRALRGRDRFDGVAITDSLHAAGFAVRGRRTPVSGCVEAVRAGADIVLLVGTLAEATACQRSLVVAAAAQPTMRARIDEAAARVLALKARRGLLAGPA